MQDVIVIGIAGGTASGKTTVAARIKDKFQNEVELLCHDCYYKAHDDMPFEERTKINYDHPNAFDTDRYINDIKALKEGKAIERPVYDYSIHNRVAETVTVEPKRVIILEGILIFENEELRDLMDIKLFVDTDADIRIMRRIIRDVEERGRSLESVVKQYSTTVKPMHERFIEPSKRYADLIIPHGGKNKVALDMVFNRIKTILAD